MDVSWYPHSEEILISDEFWMVYGESETGEFSETPAGRVALDYRRAWVKRVIYWIDNRIFTYRVHGLFQWLVRKVFEV